MSIWLEETVLCADCEGHYYIGENWDGTVKTCTCNGGRREIDRDLLHHTKEDYDELRTVVLSDGRESVILKEVVSIVSPDRARRNLVIEDEFRGKELIRERHEAFHRLMQRRNLSVTLDNEPIRGKYCLRQMCWSNPMKRSLNYEIDMVRVDYSDGESPPVHGARLEIPTR